MNRRLLPCARASGRMESPGGNPKLSAPPLCPVPGHFSCAVVQINLFCQRTGVRCTRTGPARPSSPPSPSRPLRPEKTGTTRNKPKIKGLEVPRQPLHVTALSNKVFSVRGLMILIPAMSHYTLNGIMGGVSEGHSGYRASVCLSTKTSINLLSLSKAQSQTTST